MVPIVRAPMVNFLVAHWGPRMAYIMLARNFDQYCILAPMIISVRSALPGPSGQVHPRILRPYPTTVRDLVAIGPCHIEQRG